MKRLSGRVAIVTGASRGVGKAVALALAEEGCHVVVAAKTDQPGGKLPGTIQDTARELEALGVSALPLKVDVRKEEDVDRMVRETRARFGRIDILVNNAGAIHLAEVADLPPSRFDLMMGINVRAAFLCSRAVLPAMKEQRSGHIVMMSPPVGTKKLSGKAPYLVSKMGMTMVALGLADEVRSDGIAACALWPVTMIESQATIHFQFGERSMWRTPRILADATVAIVASPPERFSGQALYDEDVLRGEGVTDFSRYACLEGTEPPPLCREMVE